MSVYKKASWDYGFWAGYIAAFKDMKEHVCSVYDDEIAVHPTPLNSYRVKAKERYGSGKL